MLNKVEGQYHTGQVDAVHVFQHNVQRLWVAAFKNNLPLLVAPSLHFGREEWGPEVELESCNQWDKVVQGSNTEYTIPSFIHVGS